ncbi:hypothetical protein DRO31_08315 [Candidatus Bathyarchaeota archaeon]|nr:MAG: hypothetical protein DRO31_08315 [Candidatus Bathyarchaeota archaeon]
MPSRRAEKWRIRTSPDLWHPRLEALHDLSSDLISQAYTEIDRVYEAVRKILDRYGVLANERLIYRCYAEELWKISKKYKAGSETLRKEAQAITMVYAMRDCNPDILMEIGKLFNLEVF